MFAGQIREHRVTSAASCTGVHNGWVPQDQQTFYDAVGGAETFRTIVSRFYELVRADEVLRPL